MDFIREHWIVVLIIFALVASFIADRQSRIASENRLRGALVTACIKDSGRVALNAAGYIALSQRVKLRDQRTDEESARIYRATAAGIIALIPAAVGGEGDRAMVETKLVDSPGRVPRLVVTERAKKLQIEGCKAFYGVG